MKILLSQVLNIAWQVRIADTVHAATVVFVYLSDFDDVMNEFGSVKTIQWVNCVFKALDECMHSWSDEGLSKVSMHVCSWGITMRAEELGRVYEFVHLMSWTNARVD